jgi:hypothetical protein
MAASAMTPRLTLWLQRLIAANLVVACVLAIGGDLKSAMLGIIGAGLFGLALLVAEMGE